MKRRVLLGLAAALAAVVVAGGCGIGGGGGSTTITGVAGPTTVPTTLPSATTTSVAPQSNGFVVVSLQLKADPLGYFGGTAEVRNAGQHGHTASMTFTFKADGSVVGTADALANDVQVGQTVTVRLNSTDKWDGKPVSYSFQVTNLY